MARRRPPHPQGPAPRRAGRRRARRRRSSPLTDLRDAIGFSSFCVLTYYAIANASAWTLPPQQRRWPRALAAAGVVGCATLAFTLPIATVVAGVAVLAAGALIWAVRHRLEKIRR